MLSECMCLRVIIALTIMSARAAAAAACASLPLNICHDCCARNDIVLLASNESFWALLASNFLLLLLLSLLLAREFSSSSSSSGCLWRILSRLDESLFSRPLCPSVVESRSRVVCAQDDDSLLLRMQSLDAIQLLFTFAAAVAASQCRPSMILCTIITHPTVVCVFASLLFGLLVFALLGRRAKYVQSCSAVVEIKSARALSPATSLDAIAFGALAIMTRVSRLSLSLETLSKFLKLSPAPRLIVCL